MAKITVEGSILPSAFLARGDRMDVRDDDPTVKFLIEQGYVNVVDAETGQLEAPPLPEAPSPNASTKDWQAFLTSQGVDFPTEGEGSGRNELVALWTATVNPPETTED
ncbi:hypothetical protein CG91_gp020 [Mycobacterium phage 39HC]|uniref:hypothetical protein n=1 Tax=Mycobacterium phage 39HC TaxID=1463809 RepID=UPI0003F2176E|nr:hypothetical protein CG91_gp020 [Mycobacterium phage 39HC]AHJ88320.1 hypothetical protein 39HC_020 [Mycobacterium phage 39HC]AHJ88420.1 hypothetical protein 40BC_020 [Mycobacterium phage 40BC]